jgi:IclR family acetate operon transcriptional repressor
MTDPHKITTIEKAFDIVELLENLDGAEAKELEDRLEMSTSTLYDYLSTLEQLEYITKRDGVYYPSLQFLKLGAERRSKLRIYKSAKSELEALADETGELASLMVEEHDYGVLLALEEGEQAINLYNFPGIRMPLHTTALGKAILAHMPTERRETILDKYSHEKMTDRTITDRDTLEQQLESVVDQGYAVDRGERLAGVLCIATPILSPDNRVQGSVCACGPMSRLDDEEEFERIKNAVTKAGNMIQVNLGYSDL